MAYKQQKCISHSSGVLKSKIKVLADKVFAEGSLTGSQVAISCCAHMVGGVREFSGVSFKDTNPIHEHSTIMT